MLDDNGEDVVSYKTKGPNIEFQQPKPGEVIRNISI